MSYDFYVLEGKKMIDYKPKEEHYARTWDRLMEQYRNVTSCADTFQDIKKKSPDILKKIIFVWVKMLAGIRKDMKDETEKCVRLTFESMHVIDSIIGLFTPREFMQIFPIEKDYNGARYSCKDYFSCMEYIKEIGIDKPIGYENVQEFLWEYWNWDINEYVCTWMNVVSAMRIMDGGKDPLIEFMENQGVHLKTMHQEGNFMVDDETGERFEIKKPKNPMRKLFSVVE